MAYQPLRSLTQQKRSSARIRCRVSRLWEAINTNNGKRLHLDMILIDSEGTDIWCQIPASSIHRFETRLQEQQVYEFQDFNVLKLREDFRPCNNQLFIQFEPDTRVTNIGAIDDIPAFRFNFIKHEEIEPRCNQKKVLIDVVGHLVHYSGIKKTTSLIRKTRRKELHVKLAEGDPVKVTLWGTTINQFDEIISANGGASIILIITSVWVKRQDGEAILSATGATKLFPNMNIPEVVALQNGNIGNNIIPTPTPEDPPEEIPIVKIEDLASLETMTQNMNKVFSVQCKVLEIKSSWYYMGCATCPIKVELDVPEYYCSECKTTQSQTAAKYRIQLIVDDKTGKANFVVLEGEAHRFFGVSANELYNTVANNKEEVPTILQQVIDMQLTFHIRLTDYNYTYSNSKYTVVKITEAPLKETGPPPTTTTAPTSSNLNQDNDTALETKEKPDMDQTTTNLENAQCKGPPPSNNKRKHGEINTAEEK